MICASARDSILNNDCMLDAYFIAATVFAYGQTSSGKTYTMRGITEKAVNDIYNHIMNVSFSKASLWVQLLGFLLLYEYSFLCLVLIHALKDYEGFQRLLTYNYFSIGMITDP